MATDQPDTQHNTLDVLRQVPFFADLSTHALETIAPWFRQDSYASDEVIFYEGDPAVRFWVVKEGQVKIVKYGKDGKEIVIEVIPPGEIFGGASMLMTHHPATAQGLTNAVTISISVDQYRDILSRYPSVGIHVIEALGDRMLSVVRMRVMSSERVERRMAHILLKMATKCGREHDEGYLITISMTRQDLADLADTSLETAIRTMSSLRKRGIVKTQRGGYILLKDMEALRIIAGRDPFDVSFNPPTRT